MLSRTMLTCLLLSVPSASLLLQQRALEAVGYRVAVSTSRRDALLRLASQRFDTVAICDAVPLELAEEIAQALTENNPEGNFFVIPGPGGVGDRSFAPSTGAGANSSPA